MTTAKNPDVRSHFRLPDPPEREPDDITSFDQLSGNGNAYHLKQHLIAQRPDERDSIIISGEHYLIVRPTRNLTGSWYPDLLAAFGADPAASESSNGYIVEEQGKRPDLVLEIDSERTGPDDVGRKREDYERLQIPEYWRFHETETGGITAPGWVETYWWTDNTGPLPLRKSGTGHCRDTAPYWTSTFAGSRENWYRSTRPRGSPSQPLRTNGLAPTGSAKPVSSNWRFAPLLKRNATPSGRPTSPPRRESANWKRRTGGCAAGKPLKPGRRYDAVQKNQRVSSSE